MAATPCAAGIPHHLIDILDPLDPTAEYSAGDFHDAAHEAVSDILSRGATPIVVGGTGFYLRTFMCGKPRGGKASPAVEGRVTDIIAEAMLAAVAGDPTAATAAAAVAARLRQADGPATAANTAGCVPGTASGSGSLREKRGEVSPHGGPDATVLATAIAKAAMDAVREAAGEDAATACGERLWGAGVETLRRAGDADGAARCAPVTPPMEPLSVPLKPVLRSIRSSPILLTCTCPRLVSRLLLSVVNTTAAHAYQGHTPHLHVTILQPQCLRLA